MKNYDSTANNPNQYFIDDWISQYQAPTADSGITVNYGATSVPLQVNTIDYVYHALLDNQPLWPSDGTPNSAAVHDALQTRTYITSVNPTVNGAASGCVSFSNGSNGKNPCSSSNGGGYPSGVTQTIGFTSGTRFWQSGINAPVGFYFIPAGGSLTKTETVVFTLKYTQINEFKGAAGDSFCVADGSSATSPNPPANCQGTQRSFVFTITVTPADHNAPTITAAPSCSATHVTGKVADADDPGGRLSYHYQVDGGATQNGTTASAYTIDMSGYDQLISHSVKIWVDDVTSSGTPGNLGSTYASPVAYGPCYNPVCGSSTTQPAIVEVGVPFTLTSNVTFTAHGPPPDNGPGPQPSTINGTLTEVIDGQSASANNQSMVRGSFTINTPGTYAVDFNFSDGPTVQTGSCSGVPVVVAYLPFFRVSGGDVAAGDTTSTAGTCSPDLNAGIYAFNGGASRGWAGSGGNLAAFAANVVNGYATATPSAAPPGVGNPPEGLTFANDDAGRPYGGNYGYASCAPDYYGLATSHATQPIGPTSSVDLSSLDDVPGSATNFQWYLAPAGGALTLTDSAPIAGHVVVAVDGDVLINSNISKTTGGWANIDQLPLLYIIASGDIYIDSSVTNLAGVYVAQTNSSVTEPSGGGHIFTCTNGGSLFALNQLPGPCSNAPLSVSGAFVANQVRLQRLYGTIAKGVPAEQFTFDPNLWLTNPLGDQLIMPGQPNYTSISALPPVL